MSLHYEWMLSLWLHPETPPEYLDELRYHLGITDERPATLELGDDQILAPGRDDDLPGGTVTALSMAQPFTNRPAVWGLHIRRFILDDAIYDLLAVVPPWLARWSATQGWIGFAREEMSLDIWLNFYAAAGHAYVAGPGEQPTPVTNDTPAFPARTQTTINL